MAKITFTLLLFLTSISASNALANAAQPYGNSTRQEMRPFAKLMARHRKQAHYLSTVVGATPFRPGRDRRQSVAEALASANSGRKEPSGWLSVTSFR